MNPIFIIPSLLLAGSGDASGYPPWQTGLWLCMLLCILLLASGFMRGWRAGGGRRFCSLIGWALAIPAGWFSAPLWPYVLGHVLAYPDPVLAFAGGLACGLAVWLVCAFIGHLLFPHTHQIEGMGRRLKYGFTGAVFGIIGSLAFIILLAWITMVVAHVGERVLAFQQAGADPAPDAEAAGGSAQSGLANRGLVYVIRLNHTWSELPGYSLLARLDPVPPRHYRIMEKTALVVRDRAALERLREHPDVRGFLEHPRFLHLAEDEEVIELWEQGNVHGLLSHPKVKAFSQDPVILEQWQSLDLEHALDYALEARPT